MVLVCCPSKHGLYSTQFLLQKLIPKLHTLSIPIEIKNNYFYVLIFAVWMYLSFLKLLFEESISYDEELK